MSVISRGVPMWSGVEIGEVLSFVLVVMEDLGQGFVAAFVGVLLQ